MAEEPRYRRDRRAGDWEYEQFPDRIAFQFDRVRDAFGDALEADD